MATLGARLKKPKHQKTDSEALEDLSSAFHDLDIDGEGLLDQASFLTALRMLGVTLPPSELEKIFMVLDEDSTGMIEYDRLKEFMKIGKIPSTVLDKVKSTGNSSVLTKRTSIMFGGAPLLQQNGPSKLPILSEEKEEKMDVQRVKMIQRAVIVIKKAAIKNISREEVIEFLKDKAMNMADIEIAYNKAQEQVMSPSERIKYFMGMNDYLSSQVSIQSTEIQILCNIIKVCANKIVPTKIEEVIPTLAAQELTTKIQQTTKSLKAAEQQKDTNACTVHKRDLKTLQMISQCVTNQQYFHAFLYLYQLEAVVRESMPQLQEFVNDYGQ